MTHPLIALQAGLVAAWRTAGLAVFDAPPAGQAPPYVTIARHDVLPIRIHGKRFAKFEHASSFEVLLASVPRDAIQFRKPRWYRSLAAQLVRLSPELLDVIRHHHQALKQLGAGVEKTKKEWSGHRCTAHGGEQRLFQPEQKNSW